MLQLAQPGDRPAVDRLAKQVHAMHVAWRPDIFVMPSELYSEERFLSAVEARELYVAKMDGIVVGYVNLRIRNYDWPGVVKRKVMELDEICVEEHLRNRGIGTQIVLEVHALARAFGCSDLQLAVYPQNDEAVAFYQKCGFTIRSISMQKII